MGNGHCAEGTGKGEKNLTMWGMGDNDPLTPIRAQAEAEDKAWNPRGNVMKVSGEGTEENQK